VITGDATQTASASSTQSLRAASLSGLWPRAAAGQDRAEGEFGDGAQIVLSRRGVSQGQELELRHLAHLLLEGHRGNDPGDELLLIIVLPEGALDLGPVRVHRSRLDRAALVAVVTPPLGCEIGIRRQGRLIDGWTPGRGEPFFGRVSSGRGQHRQAQ
jgi:hypothetical protein